MFAQNYADVFTGRTRWQAIGRRKASPSRRDAASTYIKNPPYFDGMTMRVRFHRRHPWCARARPVRRFDHHRPHLARPATSRRTRPRAASRSRGVQPADFNSYGSRRGNDDVMVRGTFANIRIRT